VYLYYTGIKASSVHLPSIRGLYVHGTCAMHIPSFQQRHLYLCHDMLGDLLPAQLQDKRTSDVQERKGASDNLLSLLPSSTNKLRSLS